MTTLSLPDFLRGLGDRYAIVEEIGRGGMSVVYRAHDPRHARGVAVKVLRPEIAAALGVDRFLREIRIEAGLQHPNIVPLLDSGEVNGVPYCVLPLIEGETLRRRIDRTGPLPVDEAIRLTREIGEALAYAHGQGVIHRDVKPENVLISSDHAMLADFGIARAVVEAAADRVTDSGIAVGTPRYMSPEQASAGILDARSDQYSLAICLYEMLVGDPPFTGRSGAAIAARQMAEAPPRIELVRPGVPPGLVAAIDRALSKMPADRFDSVGSFLAALDRPAPPRLARRRWAWAMAGGAVAIAAAWALWPGSPRLDPHRVVVFPGRAPAALGGAEAGLRIADAIQLAVEHTAPLKWIPAWGDLTDSLRADPGRLSSREAGALARRRQARYFVLSAAAGTPEQPSVLLWLHDVAGDSIVAQASAAGSAATPLPSLALSALPKLLGKILDPDARIDLSALADRKLSAMAAFFEAEAAYRNARFSEALDGYRRAVAEDSLFAFAAIKGAQAASWENRLEEALDLLGRARGGERLLPPKYRRYLDGIEAYQAGRADQAVAGFEAALAEDPQWVEAEAALGDAYYHLVPTRPVVADSAARAAFERAAAIDSSFTPALFHLAEIAIRAGDGRAALRYQIRAARGGNRAWQDHLGAMLGCVVGRDPAGYWRELVGRSVTGAMMAARSLAAGGHQAGCAEAGFREVLAADSPPAGTAWGAALGLQGLLVARGHGTEAARLVDSVRTAISARILAFALIGAYADSAYLPVARAAEEFGLATFGPDYARASPRTSWAFGVWEAWKGNQAAVAAIVARLEQQGAASTSSPARVAARSLRAHLTLLRGDTARALEQFSLLAVPAPRDSLTWEFFEPLAVDRLVMARLLLARGRAGEALAAAAAFDHQEPIAFLAFLRPSLELRAAAATRLGRSGAALGFRRRLAALTDARPSQ